MAKLVDKLTDLKARRLKDPGLYADGAGLYLQVRGANSRSWVYRYTLDGKSREMGLGSYPAVTLEAARLKRDEQKALKQLNTDPIDKRRSETGLRLKNITFAEAAVDYIKAKTPGWKSPKTAGQWTNSLNTYAKATLGEMHVRDVGVPEVLRVLQPIWTKVPETASRVRNRIELILEYAKSLGYREGENPARWKGCLEHSLARPKDVQPVEHHPALPYADIPAFMEKLRAKSSTTARALEFIILTAVRVGEALSSLPNEIAKSEKEWTIPKARMKSRRGQARQDHRVPLTERAVDVLGLVVRDENAVHNFPGLRRGRPRTDSALRLLLARMGYAHVTTHGFRTCASSKHLGQMRA